MSLLTPLVGRNPRATLLRISFTISLAVVVFGWILVPVRLSGISMLPTYEDGELNLSVNCLDRHLAEHGHRTALIFEADEPGQGWRVQGVALRRTAGVGI